MYSYECKRPGCPGQASDMRKVDDRHVAPICTCGSPMRLVMAPVNGIVKNPAAPRSTR